MNEKVAVYRSDLRTYLTFLSFSFDSFSTILEDFWFSVSALRGTDDGGIEFSITGTWDDLFSHEVKMPVEWSSSWSEK